MTKLAFELTREGAAALQAQQQRLIEPLPRRISLDVTWLVNTVTGYIELNSEMLCDLGDTIYREFDPSTEQLARLKAGQRVKAMDPLMRSERMAAAKPAPSAERLRAEAMEQATLQRDVFADVRSATLPAELQDAVASIAGAPVPLPKLSTNDVARARVAARAAS
jgi:hypothetical protein